MPLIAKDKSGPKELLEAGLYQGVCAFVEDLGVQRMEYKGEVKQNHRVVICWELEAKMSDGRPFMLSRTYTLSLSEKANLRKDLEAWRGKGFSKEELAGFDIEKLKGKSCLINVIHKDKGDGNVVPRIAAIMPVKAGTKPLEIFNQEPPEWVAKQRAERVDKPVAEAYTREDYSRKAAVKAFEGKDDSIPF